ncbi:transcription antitermination factor NusB [Aestuariimicrobium ganziense]|uniref:transcription antitermination factor NusB n=1 Tax=Aestuariimicrobium ganziense TaxID=2773677 RepID=UPI0019443599|nr:transcription antitermination factor NusB [Aestuariimicrobium ganziense]
MPDPSTGDDARNLAGRSGRPHFSARTKARKRALDILFEADLRDTDPLATLGERSIEADPPVRQYTAELVEGVVEHGEAIDQRLRSSLSAGWSLDRMPRVDRALARLAIYEIDHARVPARVAIAEALLLAGELSTDESPSFLNGVLSAVAGQPLMDEDELARVHDDEVAAEQA